MPHRIGSILVLFLLTTTPALAQPAASSASVLLVTVRVLSQTEPADQFDIRDANVRSGTLPRRTPPDVNLADVLAGSPEIVVLDQEGLVLHRQRFTWSRVLTIPPAAPGTVNDGTPNFIVIPQPEVTLVLPHYAAAARVEVRPAAGGQAAARAITAEVSSPLAAVLGTPAPVPSAPGALNVLFIASGFTADRIGQFPGIASTVQSQLMAVEPFRSAGAAVVFRSVQAITSLGCNPACNGIERLMCCNNAQVINTAAASGLPFDEIVVIHDTATYAGSGSRDIGGYRNNSYSTFATAYNGPWTAPMVKHELGHSFGNLCDEYTYGSEPYVYNACANCRPACSDLSPYGACLASCDAAPSFFRPEPSIMLDLQVPAFNNASVRTPAPLDGLATRLTYFLGSGSVPPAPTGLQASTTPTSVTVSWSASPGATSYRLVVGSSPGAANLFDGTVGSSTTASGPVPPGLYYWRVYAVNLAGSSPPSAESQFTIGSSVTPPGAPASLQAQVHGSNVTLSWSAPASAVPPSPAAGYTLQVGSAPGASNVFSSAVGNVLSVSGAVPDGSYFWRVIATNAAGSSPPSAESQFTVGCVSAPGPPASFTYTVLARTVTLHWAAPASGGPPAQYVLEVGSASGLSNLATIPTASTAVSLATPAPPGAFYVRIRAQNACGTGAASNEQLIVVP